MDSDAATAWFVVLAAMIVTLAVSNYMFCSLWKSAQKEIKDHGTRLLGGATVARVAPRTGTRRRGPTDRGTQQQDVELRNTAQRAGTARDDRRNRSTSIATTPNRTTPAQPLPTATPRVQPTTFPSGATPAQPLPTAIPNVQPVATPKRTTSTQPTSTLPPRVRPATQITARAVEPPLPGNEAALTRLHGAAISGSDATWETEEGPWDNNSIYSRR